MDTIFPSTQSTSAVQPSLSHGDHSVGWISALPLELTAARAMLDHVHPSLPQRSQDDNVYTLGTIGKHNVVLACLPSGQMGNNPATAIATQMRSTFPAIRFGLMVGIGGGCPSAEHDSRLGDVVVSKPGKHDGGVIQFDFGRTVEEGRFIRNGVLNAPPTVLLNAISTIQAAHNLSGNQIEQHLSLFRSTNQKKEYAYQGSENDLLFQSDYDHNGDQLSCQHCDRSRLVMREDRSKAESPMVHYGTIASGNQVMRHGATRERLRRETGALCFEMEAAGLMNTFPCLVIRGICDYADSHKSKTWQAYSAATAAAYAKELLFVVPETSLSAPPPRQPTTPRENVQDELGAFSSASTLSHLPLQRNPFFSGRKSTLESIDTHFRNCTSQEAYILQGMGGLGKTQIALEYAYQAVGKGFDTFWVNCTTPETLHLDFQSLQRTMKAIKKTDNEEDRVAVLRWLDFHDHWVLIFDNADDPSFPYGEWIPGQTGSPSARRILFTTRDERLANAIVNFKDNVPLMDLTESVDLFNIHTSKTLETSDRSQDNVSALVERLGNLPLAITLASSYLREYPWITIEEYLKQLQKFSDRAKLFGYKRSFSNYNHSIMSTWEVSFIKVQVDNPQAAEILTVLGFLENKGVPFDRLKRASRNIDVDKLKFLEDSTTLQQSLGLLRSLALIYFDGATLTLHPLVHEWIQARLNISDLVAWGMTTLRVIYHAWVADSYPQSGIIPMSQGWLEHTLFALNAIEGHPLPRSEVHEECYFLLLCILVPDGKTTRVLREFENSLEIHAETGMLSYRPASSVLRRESNETQLAHEDKAPKKSLSFRLRSLRRKEPLKPENGSSATKSVLSRFHRTVLSTSRHRSDNTTWFPSNTEPSITEPSNTGPSKSEPRPCEPPISIEEVDHDHRIICSLARLFEKNIRPDFGVATHVCTKMALRLIELRVWWMIHQFTIPDRENKDPYNDPHLNKLRSFLSLCDLIPMDDDSEAPNQFPPHVMWLLFTYVSCAGMNVGRRIEMAMEKHIEPLKIVLLQKAHQICKYIRSQSREKLLLDAAISYAVFIDQRSLGAPHWLPVQACLMRSMKYVFEHQPRETTSFLDFVCQSMWELGQELALWKLCVFIESMDGRISDKWTERLSNRWKVLRTDKDIYKVSSESERALLSVLSATGIR